MHTKDILMDIGHFTSDEIILFNEYTTFLNLNKNDILLNEGEICKCFYFIKSGSCFQFRINDKEEYIIDFHLENEWMFNQESITEQKPSNTSFKVYSKAEIIELSLINFHQLCTKSNSFLQFGKILNQTKIRTSLFDQALSPTDKYDFIINTKPELTKKFPLKMIASYLKITPETLSRVRANY